MCMNEGVPLLSPETSATLINGFTPIQNKKFNNIYIYIYIYILRGGPVSSLCFCKARAETQDKDGLF